ncbi:cytochrome P450 [Mycobacterium sp. CBMA293]|uniref:cytochrome P450 n=1 Tax=unclassified Mycolicibacterium TaxID=2636767 RepID=UPI0012DF88B1|nr:MULTISPECIES: cytochrome P450 [unclassified Mycolicibacterium]MUL48512.1 cytochrome P450 [Mycolicibacterium sp. CBMA 360]MUL61969.1 cytochrome P450 [Mycolicibacterium sp. CBMA 335]MUL73244.1 cytochrome P450 [Mycolicibacterium sp. CBMA 311]MUL96413.1 cytochrome P450 [Mycolicibacterium sp. CBMA 230]MUM05309.1 cytochrome P450 [Mycolicibacterium sp. CBMA 213]
MTKPLRQNSLPPPRVRLPKLVQGTGLTVSRRGAMRYLINRYGRVFEFNVPFFGRSIVVSDPALVRSVHAASADQLINYHGNLSNFFGPGSIFALDGSRHHDRRRLLAPAFHGRSLKNYEAIIVDETLRESANWSEGNEFRILEPMHRITLNAILRIIFGADGAEIAQLRDIIPRYTKVGSMLAKFMPVPKFRTRRFSPWRKLDEVRREFDRTVLALIDKAERDPSLSQRPDVLALLVRSRHVDGIAMSRLDVCDELVTLVGAGHETTASALGWAFERLRRHPAVLAELVAEVDACGSDFRRATILEVLRVRPIIDYPGRRVSGPYFDLGGWRIPHNRNVFVSLADLHENPDVFPHPECFDPDRFRDTAAPAWLAFGSGARRCIGSDFAIFEMDIVLRTVLQNFQLHTDGARDEKLNFRGVAYAPKRGGRVRVNRRKLPTCQPS